MAEVFSLASEWFGYTDEELELLIEHISIAAQELASVLDAEIGAILEEGLAAEAGGKSVEELGEERNALITAHLKAVRGLR